MIAGHLLDNLCWMGGLCGKEQLIAVTKANTIFHYGDESKYPAHNQPSCSQAEWTVSMSDVLKIFWHAIEQWPVSTTTSKATQEQEMPEDPSPPGASAHPRGHPISLFGLLIVQYPHESQGTQGHICE